MINSNKRFQTKNHIMSVFIQLYKEKNISSISVKEICEKAGINRSTFYAYYKDLKAIQEQLENDALVIVRDFLRNIIAKYKNFDLSVISRDLIKALHRNNDILFIVIKRNKKAYVDKVMQQIQSGAFFDISNMSEEKLYKIKVAIEYHISGVINAISNCIEEGGDIDRLIEEIIDIGTTGAITFVSETITKNLK